MIIKYIVCCLKILIMIIPKQKILYDRSTNSAAFGAL